MKPAPCTTRGRPLYRLALVLLTACGATALGHQLLWTRRLTDLLGATSESIVRVFGCFFLGMAVGAATVALTLPRIQRPWRLLAGSELGVALLCLPVWLLPEWTAWIWPALSPERLAGWQGSSLKSALSFFLVFPPALLMGMSLPLLVDTVGRSQRHSAAQGIRLYAFHTLGGVIGLVLVIGLGIPTLGMASAMLLLIGVNVAIAAVGLVQDHRAKKLGEAAEDNPVSASAAAPHSALGWPLVVAFCSGAGVLALEVLAVHLVGLAALLSFFHPAAVLTCVILVLAMAAGVIPWASRRCGGAPQALPLTLAVTALLTALIPVVFMNRPIAQGNLHYAHGLADFLFRILGVSLISLGPALLFAGMVFPLCVMWGDGSLARRRLGHCLALNGVGGFLGAEVSLRILLPRFGVHVAIGVVGAFYALLALAVWIRVKASSRAGLSLLVTVMAAVGFVVIGLLPKLPVYLHPGMFAVIEVKAGPEGNLAVVEGNQFGRAMILDNQYVLGNTGAAADMERQAHLPLLLHPSPERVAFIGLGTGITAAGALRHGPVKSITAIELSPLVARAAATHFSEFNQGVCTRSNVSVLVEDARPHLAAARASYDAIIGDLFTPWRPGEAALCSLEQFRAAREALRPGGVFCQWVPMHQLTPEQFEMIARTFQAVFPEVHLFRNHLKAKSIPLALVGFRQARLDWSVVAERCAEEIQRARLSDPICRHPEGVAMLYLGRYAPPATAPGDLNTLGNLRIELDAGRKWILGRNDEYYHGAGDLWLKFIQSQLTRLEEALHLPQSLSVLPEVGLLASRWEAARELDRSEAPALFSRLVSQMPRALSSDASADWSLWAGSQPPFQASGASLRPPYPAASCGGFPGKRVKPLAGANGCGLEHTLQGVLTGNVDSRSPKLRGIRRSEPAPICRFRSAAISRELQPTVLQSSRGSAKP